MHVNENEILAILLERDTKDLPDETRQHLASCPSCKAEAEEMSVLVKALKALQDRPRDIFSLRQSDQCPDDMKLYQFLRRTLTGREHKKIQSHLCECEYCLYLIGTFIREDQGREILLADSRSIVYTKEEKNEKKKTLGEWIRNWNREHPITVRWAPRAALPALAAMAMVFFYLNLAPMQMDTTVMGVRAFATRDIQEFEVKKESQLYTGDRLYFEVNLSKDAFFYAMAFDSKGSVDLLFPNPKVDLDNHFQKGKEYRIPNDESGAWPLGEEIGKETIIFVSSIEGVENINEIVSVLRKEIYGIADREQCLVRIQEVLGSYFDSVDVKNFDHHQYSPS